MSAPREALLEEVLAHLSALMSYRRRAFSAQPPHREVSLPQLHVLMTVQEQGPMMISELAHLLCISTPSVSSIIDRMEEHELVRRVRDVVDRRVVHVEISDHGRSVVEELSGLKRDHIRRLLDALTDDELRDVLRGVEAVRRAVARLHEAADEGAVEAVP